MEISVKRIGSAKGTVGWLAKGLETGALVLEEGRIKGNGHHGLWIKGEGISQFLAAWNVYDLSAHVLPNAASYHPADAHEREGLWTDAAWESLMSIARQWCDACNEAVSNEAPQDFSIRRVEAKVSTA